MLSNIKRYFDFSSINSSIKYLSIVAFFTGTVLGYFFTIIVILQKYAGYSESTIGIIASSFSFGLMSAGFFVSKTLDRFGLFNTLIFSVCIQALCVISMFVYFNPINFVICHFIMGLTGGMNWMTMDTWVNIVSNNNNRGKSIGLYNSAISIGFGVGPLIVAVLGSKGSLPIFICLILMAFRILMIILIKKHIENVDIPKQKKQISFSFIAMAPFVFVAIFIGGINDSTFGALFPAFMINEFFSDRQIGFYYFLGAFAGVLSQPFVGALSDKIDKRKLIFIFLCGNIIWPLLLLKTINLDYAVYISVIIWGCSSISLYTVTLAYLGQRIKIKEIAIATSLFIIIYEAGEFIGPISVGIVMDSMGNNGFIYSLLIFTSFSIIIGFIRSVLKNENKNN